MRIHSIVIVVLWTIIVASSNYQEHHYELTDIKDQYLLGESSTYIVPSVMVCGTKCSSDPQCKSYGFNTQTSNCSLYHRLVWTVDLSVEVPGQRYYHDIPKECPKSKNYTLNATGEICYKLFEDRLNWAEAAARCELDNGHMFLCDSAVKISIAKTLTSITGKNPQGVYLDGVCTDQRWTWRNGVLINDSLWRIIPTSSTCSSARCVVMHKGRLIAIKCSNARRFLCEMAGSDVVVRK